MKGPLRRVFVFCAVATASICVFGATARGAASSAPQGNEKGPSLHAQVREAILRAVEWLKTQQRNDGSFADSSVVNEDGSLGSPGVNPALTALVVHGIAKSPLADELRKTDMVQRAVAYIRGSVKPDGGIYDEPLATTYQTSVCLCALAAFKDPVDAPVVAGAQKYLKSLQASERVGVSISDQSFGGWGYSAGARETDLSNLHFALTALRESGLSSQDAVWEKAVQFVQKCQNLTVDGGFIYRPNESKAGVDEKGNFRSYASMTYAGLLSFIHCNVDRDDSRVQAAVGWLKKHYNLEENVPIGKQGLYYSYHTMAKALAAYGEKTLVLPSGEKHNWFPELASTLFKKQNPKGFWVNTSPRWFETDRVLVTAYAILALAEGYAASQ